MNKLPKAFKHPYTINPKFEKSAAYFSMEFGIDQSFKIYSGGLGFLAGSHMRSAYDTKQNMIGIGILWKYGYYDQIRKHDQSMDVLFQEKVYSYLVDTHIKFSIKINNHPVVVKAFYLDPDLFGTVPMFFLTTDVPENDYLARSTTFKLYDSDPKAKIAQSIVLGKGGAKLLDELGYSPEVYHLNEAHALSAAFHEYEKHHDMDEVRKKFVFTTHTPEEAGNEKHDINLLHGMNFFGDLPLEKVREISGIQDNVFNHSLVALRMSRNANGVSKLHGEVSRRMWEGYDDICYIDHITNAQNKKYWVDPLLEEARLAKDDAALTDRKKYLKKKLFEEVANQCGKMFDPDVLTIVWARRFAEYKRPDLITRDLERFRRLMERVDKPIQIIWAGKPYPQDYNAVHIFDSLVHMSKNYANMAVLVGYELKLSKKLKLGSDVWLNNPRITREASGTSGMTSAMNAGVNFSTFDGWVCEFAEHGKNAFILPEVDYRLPHHEQDTQDMDNLFDILENEIIPAYYDKKKWNKIVSNSMNQVVPFFDADRMAEEYYTKIYNAKPGKSKK